MLQVLLESLPAYNNPGQHDMITELCSWVQHIGIPNADDFFTTVLIAWNLVTAHAFPTDQPRPLLCMIESDAALETYQGQKAGFFGSQGTWNGKIVAILRGDNAYFPIVFHPRGLTPDKHRWVHAVSATSSDCFLECHVPSGPLRAVTHAVSHGFHHLGASSTLCGQDLAAKLEALGHTTPHIAPPNLPAAHDFDQVLADFTATAGHNGTVALFMNGSDPRTQVPRDEFRPAAAQATTFGLDLLDGSSPRNPTSPQANVAIVRCGERLLLLTRQEERRHNIRLAGIQAVEDGRLKR